LARDRKQVIETRGPELVLDVAGESLVFAEDDSEDHGAPPPTRSAPDRGFDAITKSIADSRDSPAASHLPPRAGTEDDGEPLTVEPRTLVEPVRYRARLRDVHIGLENGPTRRRATHREREQYALAHSMSTKSAHLGRHAHGP